MPIPGARCGECGELLSQRNWYPSLKRIGRRICRACLKGRTKKWFAENPGKAAEYSRRHYAKHRDECLLRRRSWVAENLANVRAREKQHRDELRAEVYRAYGSRCACCGETRAEFLTIDHVNNDGAAHRREMKSRARTHLYRLIKKAGFPARFRILCYNCNQSRGRCGYCPHEREGSGDAVA